MQTIPYLEFYGFKKEPFSAAPDESFWFASPQHNEALIKILNSIDTYKGLTLVIGDIGLGKTTLARKILRVLVEKGNYEPALIIIVHSTIGSVWFLKKISALLKIKEKSDEPVEIVSMISKRLLDMYKEGKIPVFLIDEANMIRNIEVMEEIRGLLNIEIPGKRLLNFILFGLPETEINLKMDMPLYERIALRVKLEPLDINSTKGYIIHRIQIAGGDKELFMNDTYEIIYKHSKGKPRLINTICDNSLIEGFLRKKKKIDAEIVKKVIKEMNL